MLAKVKIADEREWQTADNIWIQVLTSVNQLTPEQQKQNLRAIDELAAKLKPEQRAELHKILAEWYGGWRSGGAGGSRPPRPSQ